MRAGGNHDTGTTGKTILDLERQVAELRGEQRPLRPLSNVTETFGMFAADPDFDEIVRLGREYRDHVNSKDE